MPHQPGLFDTAASCSEPSTPRMRQAADGKPARSTITAASLRREPPLRPSEPTREADAGEAATPQLLREREAANLLAISPRKLWELRERGEIPHVRLGRAVRYDVADLQRWINARKQSVAESGD